MAWPPLLIATFWTKSQTLLYSRVGLHSAPPKLLYPLAVKNGSPPFAVYAVVGLYPPIPNSLNRSASGLAPTREVTSRVKLARVSDTTVGVQTRVKLTCAFRLKSSSPVPLKPLAS